MHEPSTTAGACARNGQPRSVINAPPGPQQWPSAVLSVLTEAERAALVDKDFLSGAAVLRLMRKHAKTRRTLAHAMGITKRRVRSVEMHGVHTRAYILDWIQAIVAGAPS